MTSIERTAYPRFAAPLSSSALYECFTPLPEEIALAERQARGADQVLTFLVLLKTFQCLGYFLQLGLDSHNKSDFA